MPSHGMPGSRSWQHPQPWVRHERRRCGSSGRVEASGRSSFQDGSRACARPGHRLYSRHVVIVGRLRQTMSLVWRDDADEGRPAFARYDTSCLRERSGSNRAPGRSGDGLDEIVAEPAPSDEFALRRPSAPALRRLPAGSAGTRRDLPDLQRGHGASRVVHAATGRRQPLLADLPRPAASLTLSPCRCSAPGTPSSSDRRSEPRSVDHGPNPVASLGGVPSSVRAFELLPQTEVLSGVDSHAWRSARHRGGSGRQLG